jgi:FtsZ-binding cell division protein ZapB
MESEFNGYSRQAIELLLKAVEELGRRQEALEAKQEELRRRQDDLMREWEDFGKQLNVYLRTWGAHLDGQLKQLEDFTRRLAVLLPEE